MPVFETYLFDIPVEVHLNSSGEVLMYTNRDTGEEIKLENVEMIGTTKEKLVGQIDDFMVDWRAEHHEYRKARGRDWLDEE